MTDLENHHQAQGNGAAAPPEQGAGAVATHVAVAPATTAVPATTVPAVVGPKRRWEALYFAIRNKKLILGATVVLVMLLIAVIGPSLTSWGPNEFGAPLRQHPTSAHWFGTTMQGQDVFSQFVNGLRTSFEVGALGGGIAAVIGMLIGFTSGYRGGFVDEVLNMITNIVLVIPALAVLIIISAMTTRGGRPGVAGVIPEAVFIAVFSWPWSARAVRAQTFSLVSRDFIGLARLSGQNSWKIIFKEIAPNMSSYLFMMFILQFGGAILFAATLDFLGLGPSGVMSLGLMMNNAVTWGSLLLGYWWWFIPPGLGIMLIVGGLYIANVGLDEVFNPKLREM
jgi:peptide/nickel transport system permease protein